MIGIKMQGADMRRCEGREHGIDLLKIIAMFLIVVHHIVFWSGWGMVSGRIGVKGFVFSTVDGFCCMAVNCFVLCSGWIMSRKEFKPLRLVKLWLIVEFYSILALVVACIHPSINVTTRDLIFNVLPIAMNRYWFFTQYAGLFFLMPILNLAIERLYRRALCFLLIVGLVLFSFHPFFFKNDMYHVYRGYGLIWFAFLYFLGGVAANYGILKRVPQWVAMLGVVLGGWGGVISFKLAVPINSWLGMRTDPSLYDAYNSPFLLLGSVSMLLLFSRVRKLPSIAQQFVSLASPSVFSVYIIHSNHYFRVITNWNERWTCFFLSNGLVKVLIYVLFLSVLIFAGCVAVDVVRRFIARKLLMRMPV